MEAFVLNQLRALPADLHEGLYLLLAGSHHIPPHVALIHKNTYFAHTVKGSDIRRQAADVLRRWDARKTPFVLLEFQNESWPSPEAYFNALAPLQTGQSCIQPIVAYLEQNSSLKVEKPFLHGLLMALIEGDFIESTFASPLPENRTFRLEPYGKDLIDLRIQGLQRNTKT